MSYDQLVRFERPADGTQGADGEWTPEAGELIHEGPADVQDQIRTLGRNENNQPVVDRTATVFFPGRGLPAGIQLEDRAVVTWEDGAVQIGKVRGTRRLDWAVEIEWLGK